MGVRMTREAVALFSDEGRLERAVGELTSSGFDHADISLLAPEALADRPTASSGRLASDPETPRVAPTTDTDIRQGRVLGTGIAATVAGFAAAGITVATGGVLAAVVVATAAAAGGVGAIGAMVGRKLGQEEASFLDEQLARGGVLLWVRTPDTDAERRAVAVLERHSSHVQVHEFPADPRDRLRP